MGKQVDYPADTVGADGTVYPTVGENIRNLWKNAKIITIKAYYDGNKFTSVECPIKHIFEPHRIKLYCKELALLSVSVSNADVSFNSFYVYVTKNSNDIGLLVAVTDPNIFTIRVIVSE